MSRKIKIRGRKRDYRIYDSDGSYEPVRDSVWRDYQAFTNERLAEDGISRTPDGYYYYTTPLAVYAPEWSETDLFDSQNRDGLSIARRDRRRVFAPQDDRRYRLVNVEDFNHLPERQFHDKEGRVQEIKQVDLPRNVNVVVEGHRVRRHNVTNREIIDRFRASICGKRKARREVLFAFKKTGKGGAKRKHLWSKVSKILCK